MSLWKRAKASVAISRKAEEALYGRALDEFDAGDIRRGLWAQALSHAGGDESQAKGVYLRLRVRSMIDDGAIVDSLVPEAKKDSAEEIEVTTEAASSGQGAWWVVVAVFAGFVLVAGAYLWPRMAAKREASKSSSEKAPPCISGEPSCAPWERDWGKRQMPVGAEITEDGIIMGSTPLPRTVELRLKTSDLAALLYDACAGCGTAQGSRTDPPAPRRESDTDGGSRAPA